MWKGFIGWLVGGFAWDSDNDYSRQKQNCGGELIWLSAEVNDVRYSNSICRDHAIQCVNWNRTKIAKKRKKKSIFNKYNLNWIQSNFTSRSMVKAKTERPTWRYRLPNEPNQYQYSWFNFYGNKPVVVLNVLISITQPPTAATKRRAHASQPAPAPSPSNLIHWPFRARCFGCNEMYKLDGWTAGSGMVHDTAKRAHVHVRGRQVCIVISPAPIILHNWSWKTHI